jgi:glucan 1,3-beta-glucosidase
VIIGGVAAAIILIIIIVAVVVSKKNAEGSGSGPRTDLSGISPSSIPPGAPAWLDPFKWKDTADFNLTYTAQSIGDLPLMGLFSAWE